MKTELTIISDDLNHGVINEKQARNLLLDLLGIGDLFQFSEREVDFAYLCGVFNTSGIDGLHNEIQRLKELGKEPHNIIEACRNQ